MYIWGNLSGTVSFFSLEAPKDIHYNQLLSSIEWNGSTERIKPQFVNAVLKALVLSISSAVIVKDKFYLGSDEVVGYKTILTVPKKIAVLEQQKKLPSVCRWEIPHQLRAKKQTYQIFDIVSSVTISLFSSDNISDSFLQITGYTLLAHDLLDFYEQAKSASRGKSVSPKPPEEDKPSTSALPKKSLFSRFFKK